MSTPPMGGGLAFGVNANNSVKYTIFFRGMGKNKMINLHHKNPNNLLDGSICERKRMNRHEENAATYRFKERAG